VAQSPIATDIHQALDIQGHLLSQLPFNLIISLDHLLNPRHLILGKISNAHLRMNIALVQDLISSGFSDPVDTSKGNPSNLILRQVYTSNSNHRILLPLNLLVARVFTDDPHLALPADDLALTTDLFY
jgi:hypothetical protein